MVPVIYDTVKGADGRKTKVPNAIMVAYLCGRGAATVGCDVDANPYEPGMPTEPLWVAWRDGFRHQMGWLPGAVGQMGPVAPVDGETACSA